MWKKWKESDFLKKMKQVRVNRAVYLSVLVLLLALAVVLAITAATNRANRQEVPPMENNTTQEPTTEQPGEQAEPDNRQTDSKVPEMSLPVSGKLAKNHCVDVQVLSKTLQDYRVHLGIDIQTAENAQVCAAAQGKVAQIWQDPLMGQCVALSHDGNCVTVYKNLAPTLAEGMEIGKTVQKGELLGYVGDSAMTEVAEEPHLHMEMTVGGLQVDPLEYFSAAVIASLSEDMGFEDATGTK